jgi:hypothetical protein
MYLLDTNVVSELRQRYARSPLGYSKIDSSPASKTLGGPPTSVGENPRICGRPRHLRSARPSRRLKSAVPGTYPCARPSRHPSPISF